MARSFAVRIEYRDGSSRLFGPAASRSEARKLLGQVMSPQAHSCHIVGWTGGPGRGGVLAHRPAPESEQLPFVFEVTFDEESGDLVVTANGPAFPDVPDNFYWLEIVGSATNAAVGSIRISDTELRYENAAPSLNAPTTLTEVRISRSELYANRVQLYVWDGSVEVAEPEAALTYTAFTSPAADTLRIVGTGFNSVDRLAFGFSNGSLYASNTGDPSQTATNDGNGITIVSWTDTLVEITSPYVPTGQVLAVDFQEFSLGYNTLAEWLNDDLDPQDGFPVFQVA